jgi:hypothetical protein
VVHLLGRDIVDELRQLPRIGEIPVMEVEADIGVMRIPIDVIDPPVLKVLPDGSAHELRNPWRAKIR